MHTTGVELSSVCDEENGVWNATGLKNVLASSALNYVVINGVLKDFFGGSKGPLGRRPTLSLFVLASDALSWMIEVPEGANLIYRLGTLQRELR